MSSKKVRKNRSRNRRAIANDTINKRLIIVEDAEPEDVEAYMVGEHKVGVHPVLNTDNVLDMLTVDEKEQLVSKETFGVIDQLMLLYTAKYCMQGLHVSLDSMDDIIESWNIKLMNPDFEAINFDDLKDSFATIITQFKHQVKHGIGIAPAEKSDDDYEVSINRMELALNAVVEILMLYQKSRIFKLLSGQDVPQYMLDAIATSEVMLQRKQLQNCKLNTEYHCLTI